MEKDKGLSLPSFFGVVKNYNIQRRSLKTAVNSKVRSHEDSKYTNDNFNKNHSTEFPKLHGILCCAPLFHK